MKIYTKTGDDGTTGLQGGARISKSSQRIRAYGCVDEINSAIGIVLSNVLDNDIKELLQSIQNELFVLGADLSNPDLTNHDNRITKIMIENLEKNIDKFEEELKPLTNFILPGGDIIAAQIHFGRTVTRRAESEIVMLLEKEEINNNSLKYINRLSDMLFVIARVVNKRKNIPDVIWKI